MNNSNQLSRILGQFRGAFVSVGIFSIFFNLLMLTLPLYMLSIFTRVFSSRSDETLMLLTVAAAIALLMQGVIDIIRNRVMVRVGMGLDLTLTPQVLEAIVRGGAGTGRRNAQPLRDASELRNFLGGSAVFSLFDAPFAPFYVAVIYILHPALGMLAVAGCVLLFGLAVINELVTRKPLMQAAQSTNQAHQRVDEFVRNADAIEAMGMMPDIIERWRVHNSDALHAVAQAADRVAASGSLAKSIRMSLQIALFGVGAYLYILQELLPGSIIAAAILMGRALAPVEQAISTWRSLVSARLAYRRLAESMKPGRFSLTQDYTTLPKPSGRLHLERVVVTAPGGDRMILKGVSFQLGAGEFLGVIGPSGAGKTTLAKVLVGILQLRGGDARLDGAELSSWHPDDLGRHIGYVPQDVQLFPGTVRENIARMARESDPDDVIHAAKLAGVHETVLALPDGYDTDIGEAGYLLSAGQRQHIALARAFYGDPSILVLDEPNSNLDSVSESALVRALSAAKERGITLVVVTHRPNILEAADKLLLLRDGSVELYGPRVEILTRMQQAAIEHGQRRKLSVVDENPKSEGDRKKAVRSKRRSKKAAASEALPVSEHDSRPKKASPSAQPASDERTAPQPPKRAHGPASESGNRAVVTAEQAAEPVGKPERFVESSIVRADRSLIETDDPVVTGGKVNDRL